MLTLKLLHEVAPDKPASKIRLLTKPQCAGEYKGPMSKAVLAAKLKAKRNPSSEANG